MNLFIIPDSPITGVTIQTSGMPPGNGMPVFKGYGNCGCLNRFSNPIFESFRDRYKRHPGSIGGKIGVNVHTEGNKSMDISAKFVGNFIISGVVNDALGNPIGNCIMKLFRLNDDEFVQVTNTDNNGNFSFVLPNDSYKNYYFTSKRTDLIASGITSYSISPLQV